MHSALPSSQPDTGANRRLTLSVLLILSISTLVPFAFGPLHLDGVRDLQAAWDIIQGTRLPLAGPVINDSVHLGPVWFYILAVPLAVSHSITFTLLFAGALSALKFWLAESLGRQAIDARFGLLFALALALPGWSLLAPVVFTHTAVTETLVLAAMFCLFRLLQGRSPRWWAAYGLMQTLALHAHPATILLVVLLPPVLLSRLRHQNHERWREALWLGLGVLAGLVAFLPSLIFEAQRDWKGFGQLGRFSASHSALASTLDVPALWKGIVLGGPDVLFSQLAPAFAGKMGYGLWILLLAGAVAGLLQTVANPSGRRKLLAVVMATVAGLLVLAALRAQTPFYMAQAWLPFWSIVVALGWWALGQRAGGVIISGAVLLCLLGNFAVVLRAEQGVMKLPIVSVGDVRQESSAMTMPIVPAWRLERFGRELCSETTPSVLHGSLALGYDSIIGLPGRIACGDTTRVTVGGGAMETSANHFLGLTPGQLHQLGVHESGWPVTFSLPPGQVIAAEYSNALPDGESYPFRTRQVSAPPDIEFAFEAAASDVVLVNTLFGAYEESRVVSITANGQEPQQLLQDIVSAGWRCGSCKPGPVEWNVVMRSRSQAVDLLLFRPTPESAP